MNESVLEAIIRKFRGPGWTPPSRAGHSHDLARVRAASSNGVEVANEKKEQPPGVESERPIPHIAASGCLVIPFLGPQKYHWWKGGQSVLETLNELGANREILRKYSETTTIHPTKKAKEDEDERTTN